MSLVWTQRAKNTCTSVHSATASKIALITKYSTWQKLFVEFKLCFASLLFTIHIPVYENANLRVYFLWVLALLKNNSAACVKNRFCSLGWSIICISSTVCSSKVFNNKRRRLRVDRRKKHFFTWQQLQFQSSWLSTKRIAMQTSQREAGPSTVEADVSPMSEESQLKDSAVHNVSLFSSLSSSAWITMHH